MVELIPLTTTVLSDIAKRVDPQCTIQSEQKIIIVYFSSKEKAQTFRDDVFTTAALDVFRNSIDNFGLRYNRFLEKNGKAWVVHVSLE